MHISLYDAPELRNFIEARRSQEFSNLRDSRIVVRSPGRARVGFGILPHGAELVAIENMPLPPDTLLAIKHRTRRTQLHRERDERQQRQREQKSEKRDRKI